VICSADFTRANDFRCTVLVSECSVNSGSNRCFGDNEFCHAMNSMLLDQRTI
jgi:hypothetical protein